MSNIFSKTSGSFPSRDPEKTFYARIKQKRDGKYLPAPVIEVKKKDPTVPKKYVVVESDAKAISGRLTSLQNRKLKDAEGKETDFVTATFQSGDSILSLQVDHNYMGWNLLNNFLNLSSFSNLEVSVYQSKPKKPGDKTYPSVSLRQNNEPVYGRFENTELPEVKKIQVGKDFISDKTARTEFFIKEIDLFAANMKNVGNPSNGSSNDDGPEDIPTEDGNPPPPF